MITFSLFKDVKTKENREITLDTLLQLLENEKTEELIRKYKEGKIKKEQLPAFTPAGVFSGGHSKGCFKFGNNVVHLDVDGLDSEKVERLMLLLSRDSNILLAFRSVSGSGVKVFARYKQIDYSRYESYVLDFMQYFSSVYSDYSTNIDIKCKDLSRLCFISYDAKYVYHEDAFDLDLLMGVDDSIRNIDVGGGSDDEVIYKRVVEYVKQQGIEFIEGSRNRFINQVCWYCCRAGVERGYLLEQLRQYSVSGFSEREIEAIIRSVYSNCAGLFGEIRHRFISDVDSFVVEKYLKKNGGLNNTGVIKILGNVFKCWLVIDENDNRNNRYIYCVMGENNELIPISSDMVNDLLKKGLRDMGLSNDKIVEIMAATKVDKEMIDRISIDLYLGEEIKYVFKNKVIVIKGGDISVIDRDKYSGYFLKKYVFNVDYIEGVEECVYSRFVRNAVGEGNYELARLLIGYILMQENNSFRGRAVLLMDDNTQEDEMSMSNGGTGKGLFCKGLEMMLSSVRMDAKKSGGGQFDLQRIKEDTRLVIINDVKRTFNFERLYNVITDGIEVERKHEHPFFISPSFGYKVIITSNYLVQIKGESDKRRRFELTFSDYYNCDRTPYDEFGELFNWRDDEWSMFYSFMINCALEYKRKGFKYLVELNNENNKVLHKISEVGDVSLYKWLEEKMANEYKDKNKIVISEIYQLYLSENNLRERDINIRWFSRRCKVILEGYGYRNDLVYSNGIRVRAYVRDTYDGPTLEDVWGSDDVKNNDELNF